MDEIQKPKGSMKNIGVIIAFMFVVLIVVTIVVAKLYKKTHTTQMAAKSMMTNQITPASTMAPMMTATPTPNMDTSNTQLDQDMQSAQGSLDKIDTDLTSTDQSINNQSADNPQ